MIFEAIDESGHIDFTILTIWSEMLNGRSCSATNDANLISASLTSFADGSPLVEGTSTMERSTVVEGTSTMERSTVVEGTSTMERSTVVEGTWL